MQFFLAFVPPFTGNAGKPEEIMRPLGRPGCRRREDNIIMCMRDYRRGLDR
jgi:hypothetical protein